MFRNTFILILLHMYIIKCIINRKNIINVYQLAGKCSLQNMIISRTTYFFLLTSTTPTLILSVWLFYFELKTSIRTVHLPWILRKYILNKINIMYFLTGRGAQFTECALTLCSYRLLIFIFMGPLYYSRGNKKKLIGTLQQLDPRSVFPVSSIVGSEPLPVNEWRLYPLPWTPDIHIVFRRLNSLMIRYSIKMHYLVRICMCFSLSVISMKLWLFYGHGQTLYKLKAVPL